MYSEKYKENCASDASHGMKNTKKKEQNVFAHIIHLRLANGNQFKMLSLRFR